MREDAQDFEPHRRHLRALAYRMLGSRAEAEDVVQDCWLRWRAQAGAGGEPIEQPRAWLSRVATHLCLDRLQSARARREQYVGVWLPEPLVDEDAAAYDAGPEARADYAQQVSIAFLLALERLSPLERAAFLLHDVFDLDFDEVGSRLGRSAAACRQLATRARSHVRGAEPRFELPPTQAQALLQAFAQAVTSGRVDALAEVLADDVVFLSDGGGQVAAVPRPLHGAVQVAKALLGFARQWDLQRHPVRPARINGLPGIVLYDEQGRAVQTVALALAPGAGGGPRVEAVYVMRNPDKLAHLGPLMPGHTG
ncbi:MAG: RNA polymerase sigma factor SigJ [Burkholderiales bacterium]|nr:RNA polymerase sigma factor SigJ [Burkholderiales bacterium]